MGIELNPSLRDTLYEIRGESKVADALLSHFAIADDGNFLSYSRGQISFLPAGAIVDRPWDSTVRQSGRAARTARRFLRPDIVEYDLRDVDFEIFANKIKSGDITEVGEYMVVEGDDIKAWYNGNTYALRNNGSLGNSCMRYDNCGQFFGIFTKNPDVVKMLILINKETKRLHGRALVWYHEEYTVLDRIYGNDSVVEAFRSYAKEQGWATRITNSYQNERKFLVNGVETDLRLKIPLTHANMRYYPYMDTFKYLNKAEGWLSNDSNTNWDHTITDTRGGAQAR